MKDIDNRSLSPAEGAGRAQGGRPSKLTPERMRRFLEAIEAGHFRETAARLAGFSPATLYRWLDADEEPYRTFGQALEETEARVEARALDVIMERLPADPRLAMDFLARRFRARWGSASTTGTKSPGVTTAPPTPTSASVNVLMVDHSDLESIVQERLTAHRRLTGGSALSPEGLALLREDGGSVADEPRGPEDE